MRFKKEDIIHVNISDLFIKYTTNLKYLSVSYIKNPGKKYESQYLKNPIRCQCFYVYEYNPK